MAEWAAKRFWSEVTVRRGPDGGLAVHLDARPIRTPAGRALVVPTRQMAEAVAGEWRTQTEIIDPRTMPMTRAVNSVLDTVAAQRQGVIAMLVDYAGTDLLCYRAEAPEELAAREAAGWDPLLDWAADAFGARLTVISGVMPTDQPTDALARLAAPLAGMDNFVLTGLHDLVTLSGSLVIGLAVEAGRIRAEEGWRLSRIDEDWQSELWGMDEEAAAEAGIKRRAFLRADRVIALSRA